jgi:hypothetical protein
MRYICHKKKLTDGQMDRQTDGQMDGHHGNDNTPWALKDRWVKIMFAFEISKQIIFCQQHFIVLHVLALSFNSV